MDQITKSLLNDFAKKQSLESYSESQQFEYFSNYCVLAEYTNDLNLNDFETENTSGIDGAAILINHQLVFSVGDAEEIIKNSSTFKAEFVFISAKTSASFNCDFISNLFNAVKMFFDENPNSMDKSMNNINANSYVRNLSDIKKVIYSNAVKMSENPSVDIYLCTTGIWNENNGNLTSLENRECAELKNTNLFSKITFFPYGKDKMQEAYRKTSRALTTTFKLEAYIPLPDLTQIDSAYVTITRASEFCKILSNNNKINRNVFYENVRDYLADNSDANISMKNTLLEDSRRDKFCLYNNGVTILAQRGNLTGQNITLEDYQIVNGCQTSNVLFETMQEKKDINDILIPIKIVIKPEESIREEIIRSTNTQKALSIEQFFSLTTFSKDLETYFKSFPGYELYYERRNGQYRDVEIDALKKIDQKTLIKIAGTIFLDAPEEVMRYPVSFFKKNRDKLFKENNALEPYYIGAYLYYLILKYLRENKYSKNHKNLIFYILLIAKSLISTHKMPRQVGAQAEKLLQKYMEIFKDECKYNKIIKESIAILERCHPIEKIDRNMYTTKKFREEVVSNIPRKKSSPKKGIK